MSTFRAFAAFTAGAHPVCDRVAQKPDQERSSSCGGRTLSRATQRTEKHRAQGALLQGAQSRRGRVESAHSGGRT